MAKRSAQGGGSIRKRKDGTWEGRYTTGKDAGTGKQEQKSVYGATQKEVRQKLQQATYAIDEGTYFEPEKITVGRWLDIWLAEYTGSVKPYTFRAYDSIITYHLKPALGAVKLAALFAPEIQTLYNRLHRGVGKKQGLSAKTIKNIHGVLHKALAQAVELHYILHNPSDACKLPRTKEPIIKPLEESSISAFMKAISGHRYERVFIVTLFTGMRKGEVLGLTWDSIDFQNETIYLYQQLQLIKGVYKFETLKNDKTRLLSPAPTVMRALQEQRRIQIEWRLKAGSAWENSGLVFTNETGHHLALYTVYKHFKDIIASIGLPNTRFHDMRHTYAVNSLQAGDDVKTVQENLGHHAAAFTLDKYGHVTERMKKESANRMEQFIKGLNGLQEEIL
jgi:integrase